MLLKIAICEDDPTQASNLKRMVADWGGQRGQKLQISVYGGCEAFLSDWMESMDFGLVLLDIDLGGDISGMELARRIRRKDKAVEILFVTGLPEYMSQGYDVSALHFLVKPVKAERLKGVMDKALASMKKKERFLLLETDGDAERIPVSRIVYGEAFSHTTALYLAPEDGVPAEASMEYREARMGLGDLEEQLGAKEFFRCHRSYLVHLPYIRRIDRTLILLDYGASVPVSRGRRGEVYQAFLEYHRGEADMLQ